MYYVRKGKQCRRRYVLPKDPKSPAQLRSRAAFGGASHYWSHTLDFSEQERDAWEAAANQRQSRPRLGQSGPLTGQQHYVGRACAKPARRRSRPRQVRAPARGGDGSSPLPALGVRPAPGSGDKLSPPRRRERGLKAPGTGSLERLPYTGTTWELRRTCEGATRGEARVAPGWVFRGRGMSSTQARCAPRVGLPQVSRSSHVVPVRGWRAGACGDGRKAPWELSSSRRGVVEGVRGLSMSVYPRGGLQPFGIRLELDEERQVDNTSG